MYSGKEDKDRFGDELHHFSVAMLATVGSQKGDFSCMPLLIAKKDDKNHLWFFCTIDGRKVEDIYKDDNVNVVLSSQSRFISVTGKAVIQREKSVLNEHWLERFRPWFPQGTDTDDICMVEVIPSWGEYWDFTGPGGYLKYIFDKAKAQALGKRITYEHNELGEHKKVLFEGEPDPSVINPVSGDD